MVLPDVRSEVRPAVLPDVRSEVWSEGTAGGGGEIRSGVTGAAVGEADGNDGPGRRRSGRIDGSCHGIRRVPAVNGGAIDIDPTGEPFHLVPGRFHDGGGVGLGRSDDPLAFGFGGERRLGEDLDAEGDEPGTVAGGERPIHGRLAVTACSSPPQCDHGGPLLIEDDQNQPRLVNGPTAEGQTCRAQGRGVEGPFAICGRPSHRSGP